MKKISKKTWKEINDTYANILAKERSGELFIAREIYKNFSNASTALDEWISEIEGRCTARTVNAKSMIGKLVNICEVKMLYSIPKKDLHGTKVVRCDIHAQEFPSAYKWTPESTCFDAIFDKNYGWIITSIYRGRCSKDAGRIEFSEAAKKALYERLIEV